MLKRRRARTDAGMALLVGQLRREGLIKSPRVAAAFLAADRKGFLPELELEWAYDDAPQSIGHEQTISAPHMVAIMVEALDVRPGMKVLEIGGGSGWHAAVIGSLVRPGGQVITVERIPALASLAERNLARAGFSDAVKVVVADGSVGFAPLAPYDRISVAAAAPRVPESLVRQLRPDGGRLIVPVGPPSIQELVQVDMEGGRARRLDLGGCVFVPLVGQEGY